MPPCPFKSAPRTDPAKAMKIPTRAASLPLACAPLLLLLLAVGPRYSSASVQVTTEWILNTSEALAMSMQPEVLRSRLRESMGSVYVAASLPADSAVQATVDVPVERAYIVPPPPTTKPPSPPPPPSGGGSGGIQTTTSAPRPGPQDSSSDSGMDGGNSAVLAASLAIGGVGLIGVAVWALARNGPKQVQPQPCNPPVIPEKIGRPPYNPAAASLVPQPVTIVPQVVYYTPSAGPCLPPCPPQQQQQPILQPVIPVNIDRNGPTYRVFARN
jgi:hypothetical protein